MPTPYQRNTEDDYAPSQQGKKFIHERPGIPPGISGIGPKNSPTSHHQYELAKNLTSGSSDPVSVGTKTNGSLYLKAASSSAFDVEVQYRPEDTDQWATLKSYTDGDVNANNAIDEGVDVVPGEYRVLHNSGEAVTVKLSV